MRPTPTLVPAQPATGDEILSLPEASALVEEFSTALRDLLDVIEEETSLVRAGRLFAATDLADRKTERMGRYLQHRTRLKARFDVVSALMPEAPLRLREGHLAAQEALRANLAALSIAREVAETIVRNVSTTVGRAGAPATYGRNALRPAPQMVAARGIAVDRSL